MLMRRGAKIIVRRKSDSKYLILTSSVWPERPRRSQKADLPGGIVEVGETFEEGALRELVEETGIVVRQTDLQLIFQKRILLTHVEIKLYFLECDNDPEIRLSWEHESYVWLNGEEVLKLDIRQPYKHFLTALIKAERKS